MKYFLGTIFLIDCIQQVVDNHKAWGFQERMYAMIAELAVQTEHRLCGY